MANDNDFVMVRLTEAGAAQAAAGSSDPGQAKTEPIVRVMGGTSPDGLTFTPGVLLRVTRNIDWERILRPVMTLGGRAMFEVVEGDKVVASGQDVFDSTGPLTGSRDDYGQSNQPKPNQPNQPPSPPSSAPDTNQH